MAYTFYYSSMVLLLLALFIVARFKEIKVPNIAIAVSSVAFSLIYDVTLGGHLKLYHYITPEKSLIYMVIAGILIYPAANIIYTLFLPHNIRNATMYTIIWIGLMLLFEYASIISGTIVLTGWKAFPWSVITYIFTYFWINLVYRYMCRMSRDTVCT